MDGWKRQVCILCMLLFVWVIPAAADTLEHLSLQVLNDSFSLAVTENPDDLRSFGILGSLAFRDSWEAAVKLSGLTNRFGYQSPPGRLDELILRAGYSFRFGSNPLVLIIPRAGIILTGNLGCAWMQNTLHAAVEYEPIDPPYDREGRIRVYPKTGFFAQGEYRIPASWYEHTDLVAGAAGEGFAAPGYKGQLFAGVYAGHRSDALSYLLLGLRYGMSESFNSSHTTDAVAEMESGLEAVLESRFGLLAVSYRWNLDSRMGYGRYGIDAGGEAQRSWKQNDVLFSMGLRIPYGGVWTHLRYRLTPALGVRLSNAYSTRHGDTDLAGTIPADDENTRRSGGIWLIGADIELGDQDQLIQPFASAGAGIWNVAYNTYSGTDSVWRDKVFDETWFTAAGSAGVRISDPGTFQWKQTVYGLEAAFGLQITPGAGGTVKKNDVQFEEPPLFAPFCSLLITAGITL